MGCVFVDASERVSGSISSKGEGMTDHPNAASTRAALEAFLRGDFETLAGSFADDIVWHAPGGNPYSGDHHGKAEVLGRIGKMRENGVSITFSIHDVVANDEHVVVLAEATVSNASGGTATGPLVQIMHIRDGKVAEFWAMNEDQAAIDVVMSG